MLLAAVEEVHPSLWGGVLATVGSIVIAAIFVALLFNWDDPAHTPQDRDQDILRGPLG